MTGGEGNMTFHRQANYCDGCYGAAARRGRPVRTVNINGKDKIVCAVCESRMRNGLIHYVPSNGTEGEMFRSRCDRCRHFIDDSDNPQPPKFESPYSQCQWGVLDKITAAMWEESDHMCHWFDSSDVTNHGLNGELLCPARCLRFTGKGDFGGELRDPPPPDVVGQMTLGELAVPKEKSADKRQEKPVAV
jgi:hypothetical protein